MHYSPPYEIVVEFGYYGQFFLMTFSCKAIHLELELCKVIKSLYFIVKIL